MTTLTSDNLYRINDALTALANEFGVSLDDDTLNELTHHVAAFINDQKDRDRDPTADEYDDHLFVDDGTDMHLCAWGAPDNECGDGADSQNHRNDPDVITTPIEEILGDQRDATNFSLDAVVTALNAAGIPAYVEMTGGGVATIYAGTPTEVTDTGHLGQPITYNQYPILAGPGWFEGPGYTIGTASTAEFYIGTDDDSDSDAGYVTLADVDADDYDPVATAVRLITEAVRNAEGTT